MTLSKRLTDYFNRKSQQRGNNYFWQGRVRIQSGSNAQVVAYVQGSHTYQVSLNWHDGILSGWCDCAYYESNDECKHVWATILAAESSGYLSSVAACPDPIVDFGGYDFGLDGELEVEDQQGLAGQTGRESALQRSRFAL